MTFCIFFFFSVSAAGWNGYILPSFKETRTNITVYVGKTAVLPCSIVNLGTKKVGILHLIALKIKITHVCNH